jgi:hypothetical protein
MNVWLGARALMLAVVTAGLFPSVSHAASNLPVIVIQQVDAEDAEVYAMLIARNNATIKERLGSDNFYRVYLATTAGDQTGTVSVVARADSFSAMEKAREAVFGDLELASRVGQLNAVRTLGAQTSWKALRFGGAHDGAWLYNVWVNVNDEEGYLTALDELRTLINGLGFRDCHLNVFRAIAGRSGASHFVSINTPSSERLAAILDVIASDESVGKWIAASAKYRTIVLTGTYRELSK